MLDAEVTLKPNCVCMYLIPKEPNIPIAASSPLAPRQNIVNGTLIIIRLTEFISPAQENKKPSIPEIQTLVVVQLAMFN